MGYQATSGQPPLPGQPPALSFDVTEADFERSVLDRSLDVPVLLDCWAPWCGPCRALGPLLEKLVQAYGGRFVLAKLDTDGAPQIAAALGIRSIPLVVLFVGGRPVDQFTGALPEGQIRAFLDRHLPATQPAASPLEALREEALQAADPAEAEALLLEALAVAPADPEASADLAERLIARGAHDDALAVLDAVPQAARSKRHAGLVGRIELAAKRPPGDPAALAARVAADPRDFDARFELAAIRAWEGDFGAAFDLLLDVVLRDKAEARERARVQLVAWFDVCPDAALVGRGRRYLGMYLN